MGPANLIRKDCRKGMYCEEGSIIHKNCPPGTYNPKTNGKSIDDCLPCPAGKYCQKEELHEPTGDCAAGYYCATRSTSIAPLVGGSLVITNNECVLVTAHFLECVGLPSAPHRQSLFWRHLLLAANGFLRQWAMSSWLLLPCRHTKACPLPCWYLSAVNACLQRK